VTAEHTEAPFPLVSLDQVPDGLKSLFAALDREFGFVPNVFRGYAYRPERLMAWFAHFKQLHEPTAGLDSADRELIAVVVSALNKCTYCVVSHGAELRRLTGDPVMVDTLAINWRHAGLSPKQRAICEYAEELTLRPHQISTASLAALGEFGLNDEELWDIGEIVAMYNFTNRLALATGFVPNPEYNSIGRDGTATLTSNAPKSRGRKTMSYGKTIAKQLGAVTYDPAAAFMLAEPTVAKGQALGFADGLQFYVAGRLGVLGDAAPEVVAAAHGFLSPDAARAVWPAVGEVAPRATASAVFAEAGAEYGETKLTSLPEREASRLAELASRVVDNAPGTALFAAWRAQPRPETPRARAAHLLNLLREWRGGVHGASVIAAGLRPLEAVVSDGGEFYANAFGWAQPWPSAEANVAAMAGVAEVVDAACGRVIEETLSGAEAEELLALAEKACADLA
jgi:uncharacterized peroxidase-related enzyme